MGLNYNLAEFVRSYGAPGQVPPSTYPEVVFCGRSNVGKSSLLNKLMNRKALAKVSQTPGKTATINFYQVQKVHFVDLPGYGYARVSKKARALWSELIDDYLSQKRRFAIVCMLVDIRLPPQDLDLNMVRYLIDHELPYCVVLTKGDKLSKSAALEQSRALRTGLGIGEDVNLIVTSSEKGIGIPQLRSYIEACARQA